MKLKPQHIDVINCLEGRSLTRAEIAPKIRGAKRISTSCARVHELLTAGLLVPNGSKIDMDTKKRVGKLALSTLGRKTFKRLSRGIA
jgi:hypothetical protein